MYVKWKTESGGFTRYHRISLPDGGVALDAERRLMASLTPGEALLTQCGREVPAEHVGAAGLSVQDFNGGLCEDCIQVNGF